MKAAVIYRAGDASVLEYQEVPDPICDADTIVLQVEAASVEGGDLLARTREPAVTPHIIGYCAAGEVIQVGSRVHTVCVGDQVATFGYSGSHAALRKVTADHCWPVPPGLDPAHAVAVPVTFGTAHDCLFECGHLQSGEVVLIQGATGAVGLAAIQLAKHAGAFVIAAGASAHRLAALKEYGADAVVNHSETDLREEVLSLTDGRGVNLAIDPLGGSFLQKSLSCLAQRGRLITVGRAAQQPMILDISTLGVKQQTVTGVFFGGDMATDRVRAIIIQLLRDVAAGRFKSVVDRSFSLSSAAQAHAYAASPERGLGRVVLVPDVDA